MKKAIIFCIMSILLSLLSGNLFAQELGDVNNDGMIDIVDDLLVAQYYVGLNPALFIQSVSDVNCDSMTDIVDALLRAQYYVGLLIELPCAPTPEPTSTPTPTPVSQAGSGCFYIEDKTKSAPAARTTHHTRPILPTTCMPGLLAIDSSVHPVPILISMFMQAPFPPARWAL